LTLFETNKLKMMQICNDKYGYLSQGKQIPRQFDFVVKGDGSVSAVSYGRSALHDLPERCLSEQIKALKFPSANVGDVRLSIPIILN
jgi:hypothetical protein